MFKFRVMQFAPIGLMLLLSACYVLYLLHRPAAATETVIGKVNSHRAFVHDEGHTTYLLLTVPDRSTIVEARLPKQVPIKIGQHVELTRLTYEQTRKERYLFVRYTKP